MIKIFIKNPAVLGVSAYQYLTSDQKLAKSNVGKYHNSGETDGRTDILRCGLTVGENSYICTHALIF